jgi:hypothetical protein
MLERIDFSGRGHFQGVVIVITDFAQRQNEFLCNSERELWKTVTSVVNRNDDVDLQICGRTESHEVD